MSEQYAYAEQDAAGDGDLPTYDDLREQQGPNSRFGRWQAWIEKRAAERYADDTYEEYARRRNRGWEPTPPPPDDLAPAGLTESPPYGAVDDLAPHVDNSNVSIRRTRTHLSTDSSVHDSVAVPTGQRLEPCHLSLHTFGSRFIPHSHAPIKAALPVLGDRYVLIGHEDGLDVLDMFPDESFEGNTQDARRREVWRGEGVCQLSVLEHAPTGASRTPQGVVLALVSVETPESAAKGEEPPKSLRMYNLASIVSLARWATSQPDMQPVDLRRASSPMDQLLPKKHHGRHHSLVKGFKNLSVESPLTSRVQPFMSNTDTTRQNSSTPPPPPPKDYEPSLRAQASAQSPNRSPNRGPPPAPTVRTDSLSSVDSTSSWDMVDDLPLRWATDFVPLASPGSKLFNTPVMFFEIWKPDDGLGRTMLAIATKTTIFLYETPQGARAFRYVKEFYTPLPARSIAFVAQASYDTLARSGSHALSPQHHNTDDPRRHSFRGPSSPSGRPRSLSSSKGVPQLSLYVTFDKKAGLIRISDAAVSELELWDDAAADGSNVSGHASFRRSIVAFDALGFGREGKAPWLPLCTVSLPAPDGASATPLLQTVYLLSKNKATHILPSPLPVPLAAKSPLCILRWIMQPSRVHARVCRPSPATGKAPFLQVLAFGEDGVEVQELPIASLFSNADVKGKGKARSMTLRAQADVGGSAGFLCVGGQWHDPLGFGYNLHRSDSLSSVDSTDLVAQRNRDQGVYAWARKGWEDYRVFWLGGEVDERDDSGTLRRGEW